MKKIFLSGFTLLSLCATAGDTTFILRHEGYPVKINIQSPEESIGTILMLHGWNLPPAQWCEKTAICSLALQAGYAIILPDFGKTTYHYETYPETILKYRMWPTRKWMYETFLVHLQENFSLLIPGKNNFVAGLSTGGRGAAFFALEQPEIFKAAACLSADFDQTKIADEPINNGYYGSYELFPERWEGKDNIYNRASEIKIPLFLAHGKKDKMCPPEQTENFYNKLVSFDSRLKHHLVIDESAGHDYNFWGRLSADIVDFFMR